MKPTEKKCILYIYNGHLGLPSLDYKCLQALFLIQLKSNQKVEIKASKFYITPFLPMLEYDGQFYMNQASILKKLEQIIGHNDTRHALKKSRVEAYKALTYKTLESCIALDFWGNEKNCQYLLKLYGGEKYFPFRLIYLRRMNAQTRNVVKQHLQEVTSDDPVTQAHEVLESYLADISYLLTTHKYLLGDSPNTLDAYVCGYLVPMYVLNLPDRTLRSIIGKYENVVKYIQNYLKHLNIKIEDEIPTNILDPDDEDRASFGLIATAGFVAAAVMIGYGVMNDIIKLQ